MAVKGLRELNRKLKRLPKEAKRAAAQAVVQSANDIAALQRSLAPVDQGDLRRSIVVTPPGGTTPAYSQPGGRRTANEIQAIITAGNSDVRYAHIVEFGAAPHFAGGIFARSFLQKLTGSGVRHPGAPAQPFFWPGYRALRKRSKRSIANQIKKAIVKEATGK